jgi:hypothetical protein
MAFCPQRESHSFVRGFKVNHRYMRVEIPKAGRQGRHLSQISVFSVRDHPDCFNIRWDRPHVVHESEALPDRISAGAWDACFAATVPDGGIGRSSRPSESLPL